MRSVFIITGNSKTKSIFIRLVSWLVLLLYIFLIIANTIKAKKHQSAAEKWPKEKNSFQNSSKQLEHQIIRDQQNFENFANVVYKRKLKLDNDNLKYSKILMSLEEDGDMSISKISSTSNSNQDDKLYEIPTSFVVILSIMYISVSLVAVFGNLMVFYIVLISKRMRNVTNLFIANLALADILIGSLAIPFQFIAALLQRWLLPTFLCPICPTVQVISLNVSIFTLTAISIDRHRAITKPLASKLTKFKANIIIILIWCFSLLLALPTFLSWNIRYIHTIKEIDNQIDYDSSLIEQTNNDLQVKFQTIHPNQSLIKSINSNSSYRSDLNVFKKKSIFMNSTEPFCDVDSTVISDQLRKYYHHTLVCVQFVIPLFIISYAYIHMAIRLNSDDLSTNARNDSQRALQVKKRV